MFAFILLGYTVLFGVRLELQKLSVYLEKQKLGETGVNESLEETGEVDHQATENREKAANNPFARYNDTDGEHL